MTIEVAVVVIALSVLIGVPASYALARRDFPGKRFLLVLFVLPILVPPITYGIPGIRANQSVDAMATIYTGSMLVLLIVALRFVNPTQLGTRVGDDGA
ncbi:hypothetical protein [Luteimicrobium xylanilyticum]|uniref:hypothetical protein n=1 Tax=Luteimicrobium xylanilyticum TaxID=1133546 RepID=UPI001D15DA59|nr:hypothetical protein [Luteimicrobium xylanilyticum]